MKRRTAEQEPGAAAETKEGLVLLRGEGLHKAYGRGDARTVALAGTDVDVHAGQLTVITGPSGSGKTTLLHCLSGIAAPDSGAVFFEGVDLCTLSDDARTDLRARRMGFVFQTLNLLPALTLAENVELPLVIRGLPGPDVRARAAESLAAVGMSERAKAMPAELSGGQQQRVAIARALAGDPSLVWADEPTGALDTGAADGVLDLLRGVAGERTVVIVSHDPAVAARADRVVHLRDGRIASA